MVKKSAISFFIPIPPIDLPQIMVHLWCLLGEWNSANYGNMSKFVPLSHQHSEYINDIDIWALHIHLGRNQYGFLHYHLFQFYQNRIRLMQDYNGLLRLVIGLRIRICSFLFSESTFMKNGWNFSFLWFVLYSQLILGLFIAHTIYLAYRVHLYFHNNAKWMHIIYFFNLFYFLYI